MCFDSELFPNYGMKCIYTYNRYIISVVCIMYNVTVLNVTRGLY